LVAKIKRGWNAPASGASRRNSHAKNVREHDPEKSLSSDLIRGWRPVPRLREARFGGEGRPEKIMLEQKAGARF
jgi:hypothetical protein